MVYDLYKVQIYGSIPSGSPRRPISKGRWGNGNEPELTGDPIPDAVVKAVQDIDLDSIASGSLQVDANGNTYWIVWPGLIEPD